MTLSQGFRVHKEKVQPSRCISAATPLHDLQHPRLWRYSKKASYQIYSYNYLFTYTCVQAQNTEASVKQTFQVKRDNHPSKSAWFQGRRRSESPLSWLWNSFAICISRWYRAGEKWKPNDGTRTASFVEGCNGLSNRICLKWIYNIYLTSWVVVTTANKQTNTQKQ